MEALEQTMKAIMTKYQGLTNYRGSRIKATDGDGNHVTVSYVCELNTDSNHDAAALALAHKMGWLAEGEKLVRGWHGNQAVYVFDNEYDKVG